MTKKRSKKHRVSEAYQNYLSRISSESKGPDYKAIRTAIGQALREEILKSPISPIIPKTSNQDTKFQKSKPLSSKQAKKLKKKKIKEEQKRRRSENKLKEKLKEEIKTLEEEKTPDEDYDYYDDYDYEEENRDDDYRTEETLTSYDDANEYLQTIIDTLWDVKETLRYERGNKPGDTTKSFDWDTGWDIGMKLGAIAYRLQSVMGYPYDVKEKIADELASDRSLDRVWDILNYAFYREVINAVEDIAMSITAVIERHI